MRALAVLLTLLSLAAPVRAQEATPAPDTTPTLSDIQKLQLQTLIQQLEIAQLKAQLAQAEFEKAKGAFDRANVEASALVKSLRQPGFALDLQRMEYVPLPDDKAK